MTIKNDIWNQIKADLKTVVPSPDFQTWISQASLKEMNARRVVVEVPNKFIAQWLQETYTAQLQTIVRESLNGLPEIRFIYAETSERPETKEATISAGHSYQADHGIDTRATFADFVIGNSNRLAYSSALSVANNPASTYNPLYIFSSFSLGKTHILNGIGNLVLEKNPAANIKYVPADRFVRQFLSKTKDQADHRLWERDQCPDFLLLDDIHTVTAHHKLQPELLSLCDSFLNSSRQLVLASAYPPSKIRNVLPQLRSRLEWGLIAEIHPPGQRTKAKIIKNLAKRENFVLPDDVAFFLATTSDDLQTLLQHIRRLKARSLSDKTPVDISKAESIVKLGLPGNRIDIQHIQAATAKYFNIPVEDILSTKRDRVFSYSRQMAIYLCKKLTPASLKEIGAAFGNKHHSTIIYSQKRIQQDQAKNEIIHRDIEKIQELLF